MRKSIILSSLLVSLSVPALAANKSVKIHVSNINATSDEIVYNTDGSKLSHLYWRLEDVKLLGITGSASINERLILNAEYKKNIENPNSTMDDYDWISGNATAPGGYTHWSHHEKTVVKEVSKIDVNLQLGVVPTPVGIVYGMIGYKKDTFKWVAWGGFAEYSSNNFQRTYFNDNEKSISYNQYIETPYIGAGLVNTNIPNFKFDINFKYASGVSIDGEDTHHLRTGTVTGSAGTYNYNGLYFEDYCDDATMLEYSLNAAYEFTDRLSTFISYVKVDFDIAKGYTKTNYMGTPYSSTSSNGTAGASHESETYTMGMKYNF